MEYCIKCKKELNNSFVVTTDKQWYCIPCRIEQDLLENINSWNEEHEQRWMKELGKSN